MLSIRERIIQRHHRRCGRAIAPIAVMRAPMIPIDRQHSPALLLVVQGDAVLSRSNASVERELTVRLIALARGEHAFAVVDGLITHTHAALMGDSNLGGLALGIHEVETDWDSDDADGGVVAAPASYVISYRTLAVDLTTIG